MRAATAVLSLGVFLLAAAGPARAADELRYIEADKKTGTSKAVVVGDAPLAHTVQFLPVDARGDVIGKGRAAVQTEKVLDSLEAALREAQSGFDRLVKLNVYAARQDVVAEVQQVLAGRFGGTAKPAASFVVGRLPHPDALVAMDGVAVSALDPGETVRLVGSSRLTAGGAPVAVLPRGTRVYVAGQAEKGATLAEATRKTLESLRATLKHLGRGDGHIVQLKAFLRPMAEADEVRREIDRFFGERPLPPVVFVEWQSPLIEIELIAWGGKATAGEAVEYITPPGMTGSPIFSRVARTSAPRTIYVSGLYAAQAKDAAAEVREVFAELGRVLKLAGGDLRHLVKATYYVSIDETSRKLNELRPSYYDPKRPPSASKAPVTGVGRDGRGLTLDMIAVPAPGTGKP